MSDLSQLFRDSAGDNRESIHTAVPGRVTRVAGDRLDVEPLFAGMPLLVGLPVARRRYTVTVPAVGYTVAGGTFDVSGGGGGSVTVPDRLVTVPGADLVLECDGPVYEVGDIVLVVFCERAIDEALLAGRPVEPVSSRQHDLSDGIVVGVIG